MNNLRLGKAQDSRLILNETDQARYRVIAQKFKELEELEFKDRLGRLLQLDSIRTVEIDLGAEHFVPSDTAEPFVREAAYAYIGGQYRSCVFCCATAVHHIVQETILEEQGYEIEKARNLHHMTFNKLLVEARKNMKLQICLDDAKWLITLRNKLAAHPQFVRGGRAKSQAELEFEISTMVDAAKGLIDLVIPQAKKVIENCTVEYDNKRITFREALDAHNRIGTEVIWHELQLRVIQALAYEAYRRLYRIMKELKVYPITKYHTRAPY